MAGIIGGLEDILGLNTTAGTSELQQALAALQAVNVPSIAQLTLPQLQQYVKAGVLSPAQYQAISANPDVFQNIANQADQTGVQAQKAALAQLGGVAQTGSTPILQAQLLNAINTANQAARANRGAVEEQAQERGVAGGGQEFLNKLLGEQGAATTANQGAVQSAANNAQLALQALASQGTLGGNVQSESNAQALAKAQAAQQAAEYNSQLQSAANQYNTQNVNAAQAANLSEAQRIADTNAALANQRTMYNAQLPGQEYQMQMQKAQGVSGALGNIGQLKQQQAAGQNQFIGGLIGAGATLGGDYLMGQGIGAAGNVAKAANAPVERSGAIPMPPPANTSQYAPGGVNPYNPYPNYAKGGEVPHPLEKKGMKEEAGNYAHGGMCYAKGGEVHDHEICMKIGGVVPGEAKVPGDSTKNDTIPAKLSPHEIVIPRSIAQGPNPADGAAKFVGAIKGQLPPEAGPMIGNAISHMAPPKPFADVIRELEANGLEVRLCPKDGGY